MLPAELARAGKPRSSRGLLVWLMAAIVCVCSGALPASGKQKPKEPEQFANLSFLVLRDSDGKPLKNASVIVHLLRPDGRQGDSFQLKTDSEGRASITDIPYGKIRLQAIAHGLRTYGEDVEVNAAEQQFVIRLQPPGDQVSIYK
jgi:hypothetical protein